MIDFISGIIGCSVFSVIIGETVDIDKSILREDSMSVEVDSANGKFALVLVKNNGEWIFKDFISGDFNLPKELVLNVCESVIGVLKEVLSNIDIPLVNIEYWLLGNISNNYKVGSGESYLGFTQFIKENDVVANEVYSKGEYAIAFIEVV